MDKRKLIRRIPFFICLLLVILCALFLSNRDLEDIINFTPTDPLRAILVIWFFYALKSLSVVFPATVLFAASGNIFPYPVAVMVNIIGIFLMVTVPYFIGRLSGADAVEAAAERYPKVKKLLSYGQKNNFMTVYLTRAVTFVPCDLVSMLHGALSMPYPSFLIGSEAGLLPEMLVVTYIGGQLKDLSWRSILVMAGLILLTTGISLLINKHMSRLGIEAEDISEPQTSHETQQSETSSAAVSAHLN